jgi:hypothetical protein
MKSKKGSRKQLEWNWDKAAIRLEKCVFRANNNAAKGETTIGVLDTKNVDCIDSVNWRWHKPMEIIKTKKWPKVDKRHSRAYLMANMR